MNETFIFFGFSIPSPLHHVGQVIMTHKNSVNDSISDEKLENMFEEDKDKEKVDEVELSPGEADAKLRSSF